MELSFGDRLRSLRKEKDLSQEALAEMLNVSRQAVSRWEQDNGYPETEKIILLSEKLDISLDYLLRDKEHTPKPQKQAAGSSGKIMIRSLDTNEAVNCCKVHVSRLFGGPVKAAPGVPHYGLFGVDSVSFLGENRTMLGWYKDKESVTKEQNAIMEALQNGEVSYKLQYAAKVKKGFMSVKLDEE